MQGFHFVILDSQNNIVNHGVIVAAITSEKYLCQFQSVPVVSRVVPIEELQTFNLFVNSEQRDAFIDFFQKPTPEDPEY